MIVICQFSGGTGFSGQLYYPLLPTEKLTLPFLELGQALHMLFHAS